MGVCVYDVPWYAVVAVPARETIVTAVSTRGRHRYHSNVDRIRIYLRR